MTSDKKIDTKKGVIVFNNISPCTPTNDEKPKQKGLSIHYLSTTFADEVKVYNSKINTTQIKKKKLGCLSYLRIVFSDKIKVYNSKMNNMTKIKVYELEGLSND
jgi:hypothetical protein